MILELVFALQATAAPAVTATSTCTILTNQWRGIEQDLAEDNAEGLSDNSAPRATLRAQRETNHLLRSQMLLGMMKDNKCAQPKSPPSYVTYMLPALTCRTDMLKNYAAKELPASCKKDTWQPLEASK